MKKSKGKRKKARVHIHSEYKLIERVWAEHGVVRVLLKDGTHRNLTVKDAAIRARQLNAMNPPDWHKKDIQHLVENIIKACREASHQVETDDKKAVMLKNMMEGKTQNGTPVEDVLSEDQKIATHMMQYHTLTPQEISAILRDDRLDNNQRDVLMFKMHSLRLSEQGQDIAPLPS